MPKGDRTGPTGEGPMTGRGLGHCVGYSSSGCARSGPGIEAWRGPHPLQGWRYPSASRSGSVELSEMSRKEQMSLLEAEARKTEVVLRHIQRRLEELENDEWLEQFLRQLEESEGG
jgi:hypothetical protein